MPVDPTQVQDFGDQRRSERLSREPTRPPIDLPGYEPQRFLGEGAYGQVWVAIDRNTRRQVAIKFYTHRGGLDWSLLSREVEKLVFLSADRYVVQLLDVGWDSDPPYYVMEYVEQGSLDDRIQSEGALPADRAVALFREVAIGLVHAHGRGVLHCDLKPANVLLDQDERPRLADFGQSRLTHEQTPSLGTLFYMAPEQADLNAVPEARWDVYALGALLYAMLTGAPPHRNDEAVRRIETAGNLEGRLAVYRQIIQSSPVPDEHRGLPGVDRQLAEILERCLAPNPADRFPNPQSVLAALSARETRRTRRPLVLLGMIGPALLLVVMGLAAWRGLETAMQKGDQALTDRALESNRFAARYVARAAASDLERRMRAVELLSDERPFQDLLAETLADEELGALRAKLSDPALDESELEPLRDEFLAHPTRRALQDRLEELLVDPDRPRVASWFVNDPNGLQLARAPVIGSDRDPNRDAPQGAEPPRTTIGKNYAWRTYFHGGPEDRPADWRPTGGEHVAHTRLSAVFRSQNTGRWIAGVSTPIWGDGGSGPLLGVMALTVEVGGNFVELLGSPGQLAVLVDWRDGQNKGLVLQHPLFEQLKAEEGKVPDRFKDLRLAPDDFPATADGGKRDYRDPLAADAQGEAYGGRWLASSAPVLLASRDSGLRVIVQETHDHAIGPPLAELRRSLLWIGLVASGVVAVVLTLLWSVVARALGRRAASRNSFGELPAVPPAETMATILEPHRRGSAEAPTASLPPNS